jgi:hypothetical protein
MAFNKEKFAEFKKQDPSLDFKTTARLVVEAYKNLSEAQRTSRCSKRK